MFDSESSLDGEPQRITALKPSPRKTDAWIVKVEGKSVGVISQRAAADLGLVVGLAWDEDWQRKLDHAAQEDKAFADAMRRLTRRALSRSDLDRKLKDKGFDASVRERVLHRLEQAGYLDDAAYARALAEELTRYKAAGPKLVKQKLWQKGLNAKLIEQAVAEAGGDHDAQVQQATQAAEKKLRTLARYDETTQRRRLYSFLARRGFDADVIDQAMRRATESS